MLQRIFVCFNF